MERLRKRWIGVELGDEGGVGVGDSKGWGFFEHGWRVEGRSRWEWGGAEGEVKRGFWMEMQDRTGGSRGTRDGSNQDEKGEYDLATRTGIGGRTFCGERSSIMEDGQSTALCKFASQLDFPTCASALHKQKHQIARASCSSSEQPRLTCQNRPLSHPSSPVSRLTTWPHLDHFAPIV